MHVLSTLKGNTTITWKDLRSFTYSSETELCIVNTFLKRAVRLILKLTKLERIKLSQLRERSDPRDYACPH